MGAEEKPAGVVTSRWEWVAAAASAALVLLMIGFMLYEAAAKPDTPPQVEVRAGPVVRAGEGWRVEFVASNRGFRAAAGVKVEGELKRGEESVETAEATLDYVPGESQRNGGLYFSHDPGQHRLELRAHGYQEP